MHSLLPQLSRHPGLLMFCECLVFVLVYIMGKVWFFLFFLKFLASMPYTCFSMKPPNSEGNENHFKNSVAEITCSICHLCTVYYGANFVWGKYTHVLTGHTEACMHLHTLRMWHTLYILYSYVPFWVILGRVRVLHF